MHSKERSPEDDAIAADPRRKNVQVEERQVQLLGTPFDLQPLRERRPVRRHREGNSQVPQRGEKLRRGLGCAFQRVDLV